MLDTITPEEIKSIRAQYGLTQKSFAILLGIGTASIVRYEQGVEPSKANANLIRAARHPEFMAECLKRDGHLIPEKQRQRATQYSYALVSLDPDNAKPVLGFGPAGERGNILDSKLGTKREGKSMNKMTETYHYVLQQEVLNEQAANLACDMMNYLLSHGIDANDRTHPISILLSQLLEIKRSLRTDEANDDNMLEQIRGHLRFMNDLMEQLQVSEEVA